MSEKFENEERTFFFLLFTFQNDKNLKICFRATKMGIFYREKAFHAGKKSGKMTLPPQKNFPVTPLLLGLQIVLCKYHKNQHWSVNSTTTTVKN